MGKLAANPSDSRYAPPRPIRSDDQLEGFDCGKAPLNDFLRRRALRNEGRASRTYVVTLMGGRDAEVVAYYSLAAGAVRFDQAPPKLRRNMPNPIPVMLLGRMAADLRHAGKGLGRGMLKDAVKRVLGTSRQVGVRALMVHAIDDEAVTFYGQFGFQAFPAGGPTLFLPVEVLAEAIGET